jgi:predicted GH43/DUF377 family glycosyl hydrolase
LLKLVKAHFAHLGVVLKPNDHPDEREGVLNPACARLRDGSLQLYPRMVASGNVSRIGSFRVLEQPDGRLRLEKLGYALQPEAPYELRDQGDGRGCEDPRVTFVPALDRYLMAYVAFGPQGPEVAAAASWDGLAWERLGLIKFSGSGEKFSDKDAAFFPEPVLSPAGVESLALYHRPSLPWPSPGRHADPAALPGGHEGISIGYVPLELVQRDLRKICEVTETHPLQLPQASWGTIKVGAGTPPVRTEHGWLSVIHGVDLLTMDGVPSQCYRAGIIIHDAEQIARVIFRSPNPVFVPEASARARSSVRRIVFPTGIDPRPDLGKDTFDIYYGMGDWEVGRARLTLA